MDRPLKALKNNGVGYIEIRSLDVNPLTPLGIDKPQIHFLEAFLLFCLLQDSATISSSEQFEIDNNDKLVAHKGRQSGLMLSSSGRQILLQDWGQEIMEQIMECAKLLSNEHQQSVEEISVRIGSPDLTPSAVMLEEMKREEIGFFEYVDQFSHQYRDLYQNKIVGKDYFSELDRLVLSSRQKQLEIEAQDMLSFDDFITQYFAYNEED
jgi:glutamate--cysteine ligase